jgi:hypothetical protein
MGVAWLLTITTSYAQVTVASATIKGTPYMNEKYEDAVVYYSNKNFKVPARYNVFKDLIEYQQNGAVLALDPSPSIKEVNLQNTTFRVEKYVLDGKPKLGYFALLDSGKVMLYSKKVVKFLAEQKGRALDGSDQPAEFKKVPDVFYVKIGTDDLHEVKNIKSLVASFPDKQEELTQFVKKEKISPKKEEEVIKLIQYYNSL